MAYVPLIALIVSSLLSLAAIIISIVNTRYTWRTRQDTETVAFEQRKQEVRTILLQSELRLVQVGFRLQELEGEVKQRFPVKFDEKISVVMAKFTSMKGKLESVLKQFDTVGSSPSTEARLKLEDVAGKAIAAHEYGKALQNTTEETLQTIRSATIPSPPPAES